ncbi:MAG: DNA polymerase IV [Candidatus Omnitrophica bacterium]|nr:DNA polymerase IV [Candidatus Omnitrophota bacterium]
MDAFFAAIEQRDNPKLLGLPVVVGADPKKGKGRGVVSTGSYEARKFGIHSAMPISFAYQRCPQAVFLPVDMEKYAKVSKQIYGIFEKFTPSIEPVGIDEAFLDITGSFHLFGGPLESCRLLKERIKKETQLTASLGLAPTKMAAKIASDLRKPDGLVEVTKEGLLDFLWPLPVEKIWGLGKKSKVAFAECGIKTIGDLARRDMRDIVSLFGKNGEYFWNLAWGRDDRLLQEEAQAKSISNETTFERDTADTDTITGALLALCEKVSQRLRAQGLKARTVTLKVRLKGFDTYTRAVTLQKATNFADIINKETRRLYGNLNVSEKKIRLIGVKVSNFIPADVRDSLFVDTSDEKKEKIHDAIDKIKGKFGENIIHRAASRI